jgi:hypothetical protein
MINKLWTRWIYSSLIKHFRNKKDTWNMFVEGQHRGDTDNTGNFLELRIDGPWFTRLSPTHTRAYVEVNILIQAVMNDTYVYLLQEGLGIAAAAFTDGIMILELGDDDLDTGDLLGCMSQIADRRGKLGVKSANFGQIHQTQKIQQGTVEGHYEMVITHTQETDNEAILRNCARTLYGWLAG